MVSSLDIKLARDLWHIKGQAIAIATVIALGVLLMVMMDGLVNTLDETRLAYYERYRLADIFVPITRAPNAVIKEIQALADVKSVQGRITGTALIDLPLVELPIQAKAISLPDFGEPLLNNIMITRGRELNSQHRNEILLLNSFAEARNLQLEDKMEVTMNGKKWLFIIVGFVQSPEYLYTPVPGEMVPDDGRFAVFWLNNTAMEAAYDMQGAFNEVLVSTLSYTLELATLADIDRIVEKYGGIGAYGIKDLISNRFTEEEIAGLRASAKGVPPIFLSVAAFLLYIVVSRMVQSEREQIGLLKAFGYSSTEISRHYLKLVIVIAMLGATVGSIGGLYAGKALAVFYQDYFKFPFLVFELDTKAFLVGFAVSIVTASVGSLFVLKKIFLLTPSEAMRPAVPADYSKAGKVLGNVDQYFDQPIRMVLREVIRQPTRMIGAIIGIACGMGLSVAMLTVLIGFDTTLELSFTVLDRSDANVVFVHPQTTKTVYELKAIPGIHHVEPVRMVSVIFKNANKSYRGIINGIVKQPYLYRALDSKFQPLSLEQTGIVITQSLAKILDISVGETLTVDVREGRRPLLLIPVIGISETLLGSPTYMDINRLNRYLNETDRISGAYLTIDAAYSASIYAVLKTMPAVAGISLKQDSQAAFTKLMDTGAGAMRYIMALIAAVITFGIVYNSARISFAEKERDLASLRVIGFTKAETAFVLLGELGLITLLALPIGGVFGYYLSIAISKGYSTDIYQVPAHFSPESYAIASIAVIIAALISGFFLQRDIDHLDMVSALKSKQ